MTDLRTKGILWPSLINVCGPNGNLVNSAHSSLTTCQMEGAGLVQAGVLAQLQASGVQ